MASRPPGGDPLQRSAAVIAGTRRLSKAPRGPRLGASSFRLPTLAASFAEGIEEHPLRAHVGKRGYSQR